MEHKVYKAIVDAVRDGRMKEPFTAGEGGILIFSPGEVLN